jgi:hypothetical protein
MHPSILAHILSGALMFLAIYLFFTNRLRNLDSYRMLVLVLLFSITIGVHAISHLGLERAYGYF